MIKTFDEIADTYLDNISQDKCFLELCCQESIFPYNSTLIKIYQDENKNFYIYSLSTVDTKEFMDLLKRILPFGMNMIQAYQSGYAYETMFNFDFIKIHKRYLNKDETKIINAVMNIDIIHNDDGSCIDNKIYKLVRYINDQKMVIETNDLCQQLNQLMTLLDKNT